MKPLRLVMQAFGPYAKREVLDFETLPPNALFLVHGPTGAGKSTVLDAICYALYGETAGDEREQEDIRSHHADVGLPTQVELDFALGTARYRVRRSPKQMRPMKNREGLTAALPTAELWRLGADGSEVEILAAKVREVTEEVQRRLGFASSQFRQVVVLPQGRFRELLVAPSKKREPILEALFGTARYLQVQRTLGERARALHEQVAEAEARLDEMRNSAAESLGVEAGQPRELADLRAAWRARDETLAGLRDEIVQARELEDKARRAHAAGSRAQEVLEELTRAEKAVVTLAAQEPVVQAQRERLATARRSEPLAPAVEAREAAAGKHARAEEARAAAQRAHEQAVDAAQAAGTRLAAAESPAARGERDEAAEALRRLGELETQAGILVEARTAQAGAQATEDRAVRRDKQAEAAWQLAQAALARAVAQRNDARVAGAGLEAALAEVDRLRAAQARLRAATEAQRERASLDRTHARTARDLQERAAAHAAAEEAAERARERFDAAQAAVLARRLVAGAPCPVCGSPEHPAPAHAEIEPPSEEAVRGLQAAARASRDALQALREQVARLEVQCRAAAARASELELESQEAASDPAALLERIAAAQAQGAAAQAACEGLAAREEAVRAAEARQGAAQKDAAAAREERETARSGLSARAEALRIAASQVPEALRAPEALARAARAAAERAEALEAALAAARTRAADTKDALATCAARHAETVKTAEAAAQEDGTQARRLAERLASAGFPDVAAWRAALRPPEAMRTLEQAIAEHAGDVAAAADRLARAREAAEGVESPALDALLTAVRDAESKARALAARIEVLADGLRRASAQIERLEKTTEQSVALEGRYRVLRHLASIAGGQNAENLSFQRYVLAALLDEVLEVASHRLHEMTKGRYRLHRRREVGDARSAAGLDLDVEDAWTGRARRAATLSGGESFLAALALALATAEVVQRHAGGTRLDAMFIDEGFGGLDPEALEEAMRMLVNLQQEGRMVGVISHVPELREWIDVRLSIEAGRDGSHARFVLP